MDKSSNKGMLAAVAVVGLLLIGGLVAFGLNSDDSDDTTQASQSTTEVTQANGSLPFNLTLTNLEPLEQGVYEGWVVRGDDKISFGRFNMNEQGEVVGELSYDGELQDGDTIAISIEPDEDPDPGPSATIVLAGEVQDGATQLAFPLDTSAFAGTYILATPTTSTTDDEYAGVWFTETGSDTALDIPVAPEGWAYEGWVVVNGTPYSTGVFTDPSMADNFDGFSGPDGSPNKPGEDFITNLPSGIEGPLDLRGGTVVVSIEPYQDGVDPTGAGPAQVKPLTHAVAADAVDHSPFGLELSQDSEPSGSVSI